jgi:hypothetical protein
MPRRNGVARRVKRKLKRSDVRRRAGWTLVAAGSALAAGKLVQGALDRGWRAVTDDEPPDDPADARVPWGAALAWTAATGAAIAVARLLAQRGAAAGWRRATGRRPPREG